MPKRWQPKPKDPKAREAQEIHATVLTDRVVRELEPRNFKFMAISDDGKRLYPMGENGDCWLERRDPESALRADDAQGIFVKHGDSFTIHRLLNRGKDNFGFDAWRRINHEVENALNEAKDALGIDDDGERGNGIGLFHLDERITPLVAKRAVVHNPGRYASAMLREFIGPELYDLTLKLVGSYFATVDLASQVILNMDSLQEAHKISPNATMYWLMAQEQLQNRAQAAKRWERHEGRTGEPGIPFESEKVAERLRVRATGELQSGEPATDRRRWTSPMRPAGERSPAAELEESSQDKKPPRRWNQTAKTAEEILAEAKELFLEDCRAFGLKVTTDLRLHDGVEPNVEPNGQRNDPEFMGYLRRSHSPLNGLGALGHHPAAGPSENEDDEEFSLTDEDGDNRQEGFQALAQLRAALVNKLATQANGGVALAVVPTAETAPAEIDWIQAAHDLAVETMTATPEKLWRYFQQISPRLLQGNHVSPIHRVCAGAVRQLFEITGPAGPPAYTITKFYGHQSNPLGNIPKPVLRSLFLRSRWPRQRQEDLIRAGYLLNDKKARHFWELGAHLRNSDDLSSVEAMADAEVGKHAEIMLNHALELAKKEREREREAQAAKAKAAGQDPGKKHGPTRFLELLHGNGKPLHSNSVGQQLHLRGKEKARARELEAKAGSDQYRNQIALLCELLRRPEAQSRLLQACEDRMPLEQSGNSLTIWQQAGQPPLTITRQPSGEVIIAGEPAGSSLADWLRRPRADGEAIQDAWLRDAVDARLAQDLKHENASPASRVSGRPALQPGRPGRVRGRRQDPGTAQPPDAEKERRAGPSRQPQPVARRRPGSPLGSAGSPPDIERPGGTGRRPRAPWTIRASWTKPAPGP